MCKTPVVKQCLVIGVHPKSVAINSHPIYLTAPSTSVGIDGWPAQINIYRQADLTELYRKYKHRIIVAEYEGTIWHKSKMSEAMIKSL